MRIRTLGILGVLATATWVTFRGGDADDRVDARPAAGTASTRGGAGAPADAELPVVLSTYRLAWQQTLTSEHGDQAVDLRGLWTVETLADGTQQITLGDVEVEGEGARLPAAAELAEPFQRFVAAGRLDGIGFPLGTSIPVRRVLTGLAALTWFTPGEAPAWTAVEADGTGHYLARYTRHGEARVERARARYLKAWTLDGLSAEAADALETEESTRFAFDDEGLRALQGEVATRVLDLATSTRITLRLDRIAVRRGVPRRAALFPQVPISNHADRAAAQARQDASLLGNATLPDILARVDELTARSQEEQPARSVAFKRLRAWARLHADGPRALSDALVAADEAGDGNRVSMLAGALGSAATPQTTDALAQLLDAPLTDEARRQVLVSLNLTETPTAGSLRGLMDAVQDASGPGGMASLALGAQVRRLAEAHPDDPLAAQAEDAVDLLLSTYDAGLSDAQRTSAVSALGNAGHPRALPTLLRAAESDNEHLAAQAVWGLRFIEGEDIDARLEAALSRGGAVTDAALRAIGNREPGRWFDVLARSPLRADGRRGVQQAIERLLTRWQG
ncbi:MAG: HEAT repeat domain-containing protein [Myxococcales bacterium]|nr:HEAT repeat domain-containing protein [Myxococcales bacterium]